MPFSAQNQTYRHFLYNSPPQITPHGELIGELSPNNSPGGVIWCSTLIENAKTKAMVLVLKDNDIVDYVGADDLYNDDLEDYA